MPCFIGYEAIHRTEKYVWIVLTGVMLCMWGLAAHKGFDFSAERAQEVAEGAKGGRELAARVLSFGGVIFASFTGVSGFICVMF